MAAQNGASLVLRYGTQGARQNGGSILLRYGQSARPRVQLTGSVTSRWATPRDGSAEFRALNKPAAHADPERRAPWIRRTPLHDNTATTWRTTTPHDRERRAPWTRYPRTAHLSGLMAPWLRSAPRDFERLAPWSPYPIRAHLDGLTGPWKRSKSQDMEPLAPWGRTAAADRPELTSPYPQGRPESLERWVPWVRYSRPLNPGWGVVTPPGPTPDENGTYIVPIKRVYIMLNESSLVRLSDMRAIPALSITMSLDVDSWAWSFSATLPADQLAYVEDPTEALQVAVNGEPFVVLPERVSRSREFGRSAISVQGRSRLALLDSPYAPVQSFANVGARTAQQLVADVLTVNSVPMDTAVDWQLTDWLVPAGVFAHQGTYVSAINAIAAAAGGYVQAHATDDALSILARYPTMPWEWSTATPHFQLPSSVTTRESIEWLDRPAYNRVFVSGQAQGVLGQVTRAGTAGDLVAPMVADTLITHADAARQRGMSILGATGRAANVSLRLPVLEETGVIRPGKFVRYVDGSTVRLGIVRSVGVDVAAPETWQTIGVECYESV